jgi:hypothetical protein
MREPVHTTNRTPQPKANLPPESALWSEPSKVVEILSTAVPLRHLTWTSTAQGGSHRGADAPRSPRAGVNDYRTFTAEDQTSRQPKISRRKLWRHARRQVFAREACSAGGTGRNVRRTRIKQAHLLAVRKGCWSSGHACSSRHMAFHMTLRAIHFPHLALVIGHSSLGD